jgi:anti-sigma B factor antagonist
VSLSFSTRRVGDVLVVTCRGRIALGEESSALESCLDSVIPLHRQVLLHLGEVDFVDSAGLGLLVRYVTRAQNAAGVLRVCAVSPSVDHALTVTRLKPVLQPYETEAHAIADAHRQTENVPPGGDVLCVDTSEDVLAYLRGILRNAGYRAVTAANLYDALILLRATRPRIVVIGSALRAVKGTHSADEFHRLAATCTTVDLPAQFASQEAGDAAEHLLSAIRASSIG